MRPLLYLYSNKNLAGSALAIVALVLYLTGVIGVFWYVIVAGAYVLGVLLAPGNPKWDVALQREMSDAQVVTGLKSLEHDAPRMLPKDIASDVIAICDMLETAIPALTQKGVTDQVAYDVRTTATEYLPQTVAAYVKMPPAFRAMQRVSDGKTPTQMLAEQVALLKTQLQGTMAGIASDDAAALAENGRFLRDRFSKPAFEDVISVSQAK